MHHWINKFRVAALGSLGAVRTHRSFWIHLPAAAAVVALAGLLRVEPWQWCILLLCITGVLAAELMNTAIESLAKAVSQTPNEHLRRALDVASGSVLIAAIGAALVGAVVFLPPIVRLWTG